MPGLRTASRGPANLTMSQLADFRFLAPEGSQD